MYVTRRRFNFIIMVTKIVEVADTDCYCGVCSWPKMGSVVSEVMIYLPRSETPDVRIKVTMYHLYWKTDVLFRLVYRGGKISAASAFF